MVFQVHSARPNSVMPKTSTKKTSVTMANSSRVCPFSDFSVRFFGFIVLPSESGIGSHIAEHHLRGKSHIQAYDAWHERVKRIIDDSHSYRLRRIDRVVGRGTATGCDSDHRGSQSGQNRSTADGGLAINHHVLSIADVSAVIGVETHVSSAVANGLAERIVLIVSST